MRKLILLMVCLYALVNGQALVTNPVTGQTQVGLTPNGYPIATPKISVTSGTNIQNLISLGGTTGVPLGATYYGLQVNQFAMPLNLGEMQGLAWPNASATFLVDVPSSASGAGSLGQGYAAVTAYARDNGSFTWPGSAGSATADFRGECFVGGAGGACWGITLQVGDADRAYNNPGVTSYAASGIIGLEEDLTINNAGTQRAANLFLVNNSTVQAAQFQSGILMESEVGNICGANGTTACLGWSNAIQIVGASASGSAILVGEQALSASQNSMAIDLVGRDAGNTERIAAFSADPNGAPQFFAANNGVTTSLGYSFSKLGTSVQLLSGDSVGNAEFLGGIVQRMSFVNKTDSISATWTAANIFNTTIHENAGAGVTITLPTAALAIAQMEANGLPCYTGASWTTKIQNIGTNTYTIQGGIGVTISNATNAGNTISHATGPISLGWEVSSCGSNTISVFQQ